MKYISIEFMEQISSQLGHCKLSNGSLIKTRLEAYSCKAAGSDKHVLHDLAMKYNDSFCNSKLSGVHETPWLMSDVKMLKVFFNFILTLNMAYPDYDFNSIKPNQFEELSYDKMAMNIESNLMMSLQNDFPNFSSKFWSNLDSFIDIKGCRVFSFQPSEEDSSLFSQLVGQLWYMHFLFYNETQKQIVLFSCICNSTHNDSNSDDISSDDDDDDMDDDDMMMDDDDIEGCIVDDQHLNQMVSQTPLMLRTDSLEYKTNETGNIFVAASPMVTSMSSPSIISCSPLVKAMDVQGNHQMDHFQL